VHLLHRLYGVDAPDSIQAYLIAASIVIYNTGMVITVRPRKDS